MVKIESLDVLKAQEQLDLQEATRRDDVYDKLNQIVDTLQDLDVYPSLLWTWVFDIIRNTYESNQHKDVAPDGWVDESIPEGITLKQIFDKLWDDVGLLGLNMDLGGEIIEEVILDWMRENDFLIALDDDGWLEEGDE